VDVNVSNLKHELSFTTPNLVEFSLAKGGGGTGVFSERLSTFLTHSVESALKIRV